MPPSHTHTQTHRHKTWFPFQKIELFIIYRCTVDIWYTFCFVPHPTSFQWIHKQQPKFFFLFPPHHLSIYSTILFFSAVTVFIPQKNAICQPPAWVRFCTTFCYSSSQISDDRTSWGEPDGERNVLFRTVPKLHCDSWWGIYKIFFTFFLIINHDDLFIFI